MYFDDADHSDYFESHDQDDLQELMQRESWEDAQAEMADYNDDFDDDFDEPEDSYLDASYEDRFADFDY